MRGRSAERARRQSHLEVASDGGKALGKLSQVKIKICRIELHPRQEEIGCRVSVLIVEQNVAAVAKDELGNGGHDAFAVGAGDEQDGRVVHRKLNRFPLCTSVPPVVQELRYHGGHRGTQGPKLLLQCLRNLSRGIGA